MMNDGMMTGREFKLRFKEIQVKLPQIFLDVRNENIIELVEAMSSGNQELIDDTQRRMNSEAQRRIVELSTYHGIPINFGEIQFDASVDFNIEVNIEGHFFEATPPDQMPA